ncbi:TatD family hydrolase [Dyadobacter psychrotolerans]|uniref:TatD family deoxyribonuclease n=1 Tax=Dyadobacter psychrotolerans TaxID=2541721 RepID=A0A4R5DJH5_9BACT|nr:TatD family hydrolase [Dyadobacter psychrotolerans]TDE12114.1 TatD family deoxyribonuclease [Dyadobacter psychrotolerans]
MFYDIHTHLENTPKADVISIKNIYQDFADNISGQKVSLGLHPWYLHNLHPEIQFKSLTDHITKPGVIAVGECGLDKLTSTGWDLQLKVFRWQIALAQEVNKPIIIHCVKAFPEVLAELKGIKVPVIFHGINNKRSILQPVIESGYYLSFGKALLSGHVYILETFRATPLQQVFLETDDADVDIREIYKSAAGIKNITEKEIVLQLEQNFLNVFK